VKKIAYVASVNVHFKAFHLPHLKSFKDKGFQVTTVSKDDTLLDCCDKSYQVPIERSPFNISNIKAYKMLKKIFSEEKFDIIHCHTPVASILTRLAARKVRGNGTKVIYTAHGFHFFKGAPIINWLIYFPIEWICSFFTDGLITINMEDYRFAKKYLHAKKTYYVNGVGIDTEKYKGKSAKSKKELFGIDEDSIVLLSVGELNSNKNHEVVLKAMAEINNPNIYYFVAGIGELKDYLENIAKELGVSNNFQLLGYRKDIKELLEYSDVFCFPSLREGLPVSVMEAMAMGVPCIVSKIRGNTDLIRDKINGIVVEKNEPESYAEAMKLLINDNNLQKSMSENNINDIKKFEIDNVHEQMTEIYDEILCDIIS